MVSFYFFLLVILILLMMPIAYSWLRGAPTVYTPHKAVEIMVDEAQLQDGYFVYDLGCGDGRLLFEAAKRNHIMGLGFELFWPIYFWAKIKSLFVYMHGGVKILYKDLWYQDFRRPDVIFCFLMPHAMEKIGKKFQEEAEKGTKLISYAFPAGKMKPKKVVRKEGIAPIYVYVKS